MEHFPSGNLTIMEQITSKREKKLDQAHMRNKITTTNGIGFYPKWNKKKYRSINKSRVQKGTSI
jgi:hypothetical protein